jgi:hypothetical protein
VQRWWADTDAALAVLDALDGSDVSQGVASAALGFHALQTQALKPLTETTLVDRATVSSCLGSVDLALVAKAIAAATGPILGDAAPAYGALLAEDWRQDSITAADQILTRWTSRGMAWPTAVQRLTALVGIPSRSVTQAVVKLEAPGLPEMVVKDFGDRALLAYAKSVGEREADGAVSKMTASQRAEFDREHPRDRLGRFADKPDSTETMSERRERVRDKVRALRGMRQDRVRRSDQQSKQAAPQQEVSWGLLGLLPTKPAESAPREREQAERQTRGRVRDERRGRARQLRPVGAAPAESASEMMPKVERSNAMRVDTQAYVVVDRTEADAILLSGTGQFNIQGLKNLLNSGTVTAYTFDLVSDELALANRDVDDPVVIEFNTLAVTDAGAESFDLAPDAVYEIAPSRDRMGFSPGISDLGYDIVNSPFTIPGKGSPASSRTPQRIVPVLSVTMANESDFDRVGVDLPYDRVSRMNRFGDFEKALSGFELEQFNRMHPRDEEGQFVERTQTAAPADRGEMRERRLRRREEVRQRRGRLQARSQGAEQTQEARQDSPAPGGSPLQDTERPRVRERTGRERVRPPAHSRDRRAALARVYQSAGEGEAEERYDFANATALMLDDFEFTELLQVDIDGRPLEAGWGGWGGEELSYLVTDALTTGLEALRRTAETTSKSRQTTPLKPQVAQDEYMGYETYEEAAQAALEYINSWQMTGDTMLRWDAMAVAEPHRDTGRTMYFPKRIGYEVDDAKVLVFGSDQAIESLKSGSDPRRLVRIPAETLSELLALRATDEALDGIDPVGVSPQITALPNPLVRAYWYADEDD